MKYKFTKREKTLLYMLLYVAIIIGGWMFLLEPSLNARNDVDIKLINKENESISTKKMYETYRGAKAELEKENKTFAEATTGFTNVLNNEDIDKKLTGIAILHKLQPKSLSIGEVTDASLSVYNEEEKKAASTSGSILKSVDISMNVEGALNDVYALADSLKDDHSIRLRQFSYTSGEDASTHTLNFTVYMLAI